MSKEKQIEEMAHALCGQEHSCGECDSDYRCEFILECSVLHRAGYRKQSEGEWIAHEDDWCGTFYTCSVCKCDWTTIDGTPQENNMRFCPECGAKMKGGNQ